MLLPNYTSDEAAGLAERMRRAINASTFEGCGREMSASIGVASFRDKVTDLSSLLKAADTALYEAKHGGRNRVCKAQE